jgi:hypothetical protein
MASVVQHVKEEPGLYDDVEMSLGPGKCTNLRIEHTLTTAASILPTTTQQVGHSAHHSSPEGTQDSTNHKSTLDTLPSSIDDIPLPSLHESTAVFDTIWTHFKGFVPNPKAEFTTEFTRLADHQHWDEKERKRRRPAFIEAEFGSYYGRDPKSLANWQELCRVCKVRWVPEEIHNCQEVCLDPLLSSHKDEVKLTIVQALRGVLVNIVNLVNSRRTGEGVIIFPTKRQFIDYTFPDRMYPLNKALGDTLMTALLRPVRQKKYSEQADRELREYKAQQYAHAQQAAANANGIRDGQITVKRGKSPFDERTKALLTPSVTERLESEKVVVKLEPMHDIDSIKDVQQVIPATQSPQPADIPLDSEYCRKRCRTSYTTFISV